MFDLMEQSVNAVDNRHHSLDIVKTLSPHLCIPYIGAQILLMAWILSIILISIFKFKSIAIIN